MLKRQSVPIVLLLVWFSYTLTFYTTLRSVELSANIISTIKNNELFPAWITSIISVLLVNIDQYFSLAITGFLIGAIFANYKQAFRVSIIIYVAYILSSIYMVLFGMQQMPINNKWGYISGKLLVCLIDYMTIYFCMIFSNKIWSSRPVSLR